MTEKPISIPERTQQPIQDGLEPTGSDRCRTDELAITLYKRGHSARDVGELLDVPWRTVSGLVTRAGVHRGRAEATRLARRNRHVRTHVAHVTLLSDVVVGVAAKLGITVGLLLAVLADRLNAIDPTIDPANEHANDRAAGRKPGREGGQSDDLGSDAVPDTSVPVTRMVSAGGLSCVGVCSFGCTHRCARSITPAGTAG